MVNRDTLRRSLLLAVLASLLGVSFAWAQQADIAVSKSGPVQAAADTDVTYTVSVLNTGPDAVSTGTTGNITLIDPIPPGMTFVSAAPPGCTTPSVGSGGTITCTITSLAVSASIDFTFVFHIAPATPPGTFFTNVATASNASDPNSENDSGVAVTQTPPPPQADVGINKTGPVSATANSDVSYTITVTNFGPDAAQNVAWTDALPSSVPAGFQMTFVSVTPSAGCTTPAVGSGGTVTCPIGTLAFNATATFTLVGHIPSGTPSTTTFTNIATASTSTNDPTPVNNASPTTVTVSSADVAVTKSAPASVVAGGPTFDYVVTLSNGGPDTAENASFTDPLPAGLSFVSLTQNTGPLATCGTGGTVSCTIAALANGQSAQFTITVQPQPSIANGTVLSNTATASTTSADSNANNNSSTASTAVSAQADVSISKTGSATAAAGGNLTYTITVANNGPSDAASVSFTDPLPAGTTFVSENQTTGPTFACTTPVPGAGGTITCSIATLPAGASATFSVVVKVSAGATGSITNTATVASTTADPAPDNNSSTTAASVVQGADLSITKTAGALFGRSVTYTIVVTNNGPAVALNVVVTDVLPAGATLNSATTTQGTCTGTATVTCAIGTLPVSGSATITLVVTIASGGVVSNTATVAGSVSDPDPANNSSTVEVEIPTAIPTLSSSTFALLSLVLAAAGFAALRRRRPASPR